MGGRFQRQLRFARMVGRFNFARAVVRRFLGRTTEIEIRMPMFDLPFVVRYPASDLNVCRQFEEQGPFPFRRGASPGVIVDGGANIGLFSRQALQTFPEAKLLAIEFDEGNFKICRRNLAGYPNAESVHAGLWSRNEPLVIQNPEGDEWVFRAMTPHPGDESETIAGINIATLLDSRGLERLDLLKLDIEGAEREVLSHAESWIDRVDAMIVELHDDFEPGCLDAFDKAVVGFPFRWRFGEYECVAREGACIFPGD